MMNKTMRISKASNWLKVLNEKYKEDVDYAVEHTVAVYDAQLDFMNPPLVYDNTTVTVSNSTSEQAIQELSELVAEGTKIGVLDFASFKHAGGGFLSGSFAQEEALCHVSGLFPCLKNQTEWYDKPERINGGAYSDDYIFCEDVPFIFNGKIIKASVLAMAAPNANAYDGDVTDILKNRMKLAYTIPAQYGVSVLVLGAWGCGVFGNDIDVVAKTWRELQEEFDGLYSAVYHPLPDVKSYKVFKEIMG